MPNEQLIEDIQKALDRAERGGYHVGVIADEWLRALLEENKRLNGVLETCKEAISAVVTESRKDKGDTDKWIETVTSEARGYMVQLQQTREELKTQKECYEQMKKAYYDACTELEQVKSESNEHQSNYAIENSNLCEALNDLHIIRNELSATRYEITEIANEAKAGLNGDLERADSSLKRIELLSSNILSQYKGEGTNGGS